MTTSVIPSNFAEWRHCITVECGISLTPSYIEKRIQALQSEKDEHTRQFVRLYGEQYKQQVVTWFERAKAEAA
ncbi:hypothetical protein Q8W40_04120 [Vibrio penaeicida]|uniref:hypothetical protein n=1 Tax=Vibrio penaeicida TaxID=104609 RepID=UPI002732D4A0|nr:hypothetical protein [Vibrio penaeicida]MDP2571358.1 hypothetical protein [Vibrio penaeicida]